MGNGCFSYEAKKYCFREVGIQLTGKKILLKVIYISMFYNQIRYFFNFVKLYFSELFPFSCFIVEISNRLFQKGSHFVVYFCHLVTWSSVLFYSFTFLWVTFLFACENLLSVSNFSQFGWTIFIYFRYSKEFFHAVSDECFI